jgi:predicted regulator of amino acid metabolism with ACT domain
MSSKHVYQIVKPVARLLLKLGFKFNDLMAAMTKAYIDEAAKEIDSKKATHIAAKTGIDRRTVSRLLKEPEIKTPVDRLVLVQGDLRRLSKNGSRAVPITGDQSVESIISENANGRLTTKSVIDELERSGRIKRDGDSVLYLNSVSDGGINFDKMLQTLEDGFDIVANVAPYSRTVNEHKLIFRWDYSEQIHPKHATEASDALFRQCQAHAQANLDLLESFETTRFRSHPRVGIMQAQFNYDFFNR